MTRILALAASALATATWLCAQDPAPKPKPDQQPPKKQSIDIGDALPKGLTFRTIAGKPLALDSLRDKVVVFHFWSTTCPYEIAAEPKLNALSEEFAKKGVVVIGIAANAREIGKKPADEAFETKDAAKHPYASLQKKAKASKINHDILVDHKAKLGRLLDGKTTPHCFVFDKQGKLQYRGALDDDPKGREPEPLQYVRDAVTALLAGEKPDVDSTRPYG